VGVDEVCPVVQRATRLIHIVHKTNFKLFNSPFIIYIYSMYIHTVHECYILLCRSRPFKNAYNKYSIATDSDSLNFNIHSVSKKVPTFKFSVALSNLNGFSKCLHCWKVCEICYKSHTKLPTLP